MIEALPDSPIDPLCHILSYLAYHIMAFPLLPTLWITQLGLPPTYSWFISRLQNFLGDDVAGHSLRSGGATALALAGVLTNGNQSSKKSCSLPQVPPTFF
ncbi:hypothetical protein M422DRAFT_255560 [Sphaerobolus stellatus SS14]|uniref:Unplaced genomic scaffold SPHSTscaffold_62, whole genome shotgun sequence n=1 Tax=Sphaerobolus stellatus (strain SS14) TaxID=990650 RepID=A0A0C9UEF8_SPHS4|nr:hypothetical protein M422DRAFT_255560 [Sphaerobolus stellatus SS14]